MNKSLRILVIDANREAARFTTGLCRSIGLETETAETIASALTAYKEHQHQLVLAEVEFPDGTGLELIRQLRLVAVAGGSTILVHSQVRGSLEVVRRAAIEAGADGVLPKPLNVQNLSHYLGPAGQQSGSYSASRAGMGVERGPGPDDVPSRGDKSGQQPTRPSQPTTGSDPRVRIAPVTEADHVDITRLAIKDHRLLLVMEDAAKEEISQAIKVETEKGTWFELSYHNRSICDVRAWGIGPDIVDVALREGLLDSSIALRVRLDLLDKGERLAQRILGRVGADNDAIARLFQLTSMERIIAACQVEKGVITVARGVQPRFIGLPVALPLFSVVSEIVDHTLKLAVIVEEYGKRAREVIHKTHWFADVIPGGLTAARDRALMDTIRDGQLVASWLREHRGDMGEACLLLRKIEICSAVRIAPGNVLENGDVDEGETSLEPNDSSPSGRGIVDLPPLAIEPPGPSSGKFVLPPEADRPREALNENRARPAPIDKALEHLLAAYIEDIPDSTAGQARPMSIGVELDELGSEACESWLHTMSPLLMDEANGQVPEELAGHVSRRTMPGAGTSTHRFILGLVAVSQGKLDSARHHLTQALHDVPKDKWINAALALLQTGYFSRPNSDLSVEGVWKTIRNVATQKGVADR